MTMGMSLNTSAETEEPKTDEPMETETVAEKEVTPTYWVAVAREDGTLEVSIVLSSLSNEVFLHKESPAYREIG